MDASATPTRRCPLCFEDVPNGAQCSGCAPYRRARPDPTALQPGSLLAEQYLIGRTAGEPEQSRTTYLGWDARLERRVTIEEYLPRHLAVRDRDGAALLPYTEEHRPFFEEGLDDFLRAARSQARSGPERASDLLTANGTAYRVIAHREGASPAEQREDPPGQHFEGREARGTTAPPAWRPSAKVALAALVLLVALAVLLLKREAPSPLPVAMADTVAESSPPPAQEGEEGSPGEEGGSPAEPGDPGDPGESGEPGDQGEPSPPEPGGPPATEPGEPGQPGQPGEQGEQGEPSPPEPGGPQAPRPGGPPRGGPGGGSPGRPPESQDDLPTPAPGQPPPTPGTKPGAHPGSGMPDPSTVLSRPVLAQLERDGQRLTKWLLYEDFSSNRRGWADAWPHGSLAVRGGRAYLRANESGGYVARVRVPHRNVAIRFDLRHEPGAAWGAAGVAFRYTDEGNDPPFTGVMITSAGSERGYQVIRHDEVRAPTTHIVELTGWTRADRLVRAGENTVELIVNGRDVAVYINGTLVRTLAASIPEAQGEWIGLHLSGEPPSQYSFDNVMVVELELRR